MDSEMKRHLGINFLRILVDLGGQVGAMRRPKLPNTPQLVAQDGPEAAQETPKTAQEPPKSCLNGFQEAAQRCLGARFCPRAAHKMPKGRPDPLQTSILDPKILILDPPGFDFGKFFDASLYRYGETSAPSRSPF